MPELVTVLTCNVRFDHILALLLIDCFFCISQSRHKSDVYIAEGFHTDCENILKQFLAKQTSTFEDFVSIWQEKKFSSIFKYD